MSPTVAEFDPLPWQEPVWQDKAPVLLLTGSAGGGKSRIAAEKVNAYLLKYPGAMGLLVRKARDSLTNSTVLFYERVITPGTGVKHIKTERQFRYPNGSLLVYSGMFDDAQREQVRSVGLAGGVDIAWMEEATAFSESDFDEVSGRLRGAAAGWRQLILTTNPDAPGHWIHKRLILGGEAKVYYSGALDNRYNPADYLQRLDNITGVLGLRLAKGLWVQAEGSVYEAWDEAIHLREPRELVIRGILKYSRTVFNAHVATLAEASQVA